MVKVTDYKFLMAGNLGQYIDGRYQCFISKKTGRVLKATENQMISSQEWRIPCEKISIKTIKERTEEYV